MRRLIAACYGIGFAVAALAIWQSRDVEAYIPAVWTAWFACTGGVCLALAVRPDEHALWRLSGAMAWTALTSRLGGVAVNMMDGNYSSGWRGLLGAVWIVGAAWGARVTWLHLLAPRER